MMKKHVDGLGADMDKKEWPCEVCSRCGRRNIFLFHMPDAQWKIIAGDVYNILCLICVDEQSQKHNIKYDIMWLTNIILPWYKAVDKNGV